MADLETTPGGRTPSATQCGTLEGRMGTVELVFTVLAFAAPLATVSGVIPIVISFNGAGAPGAFLAATALRLLFPAGLAAMSRPAPQRRRFDASATAGLGRPAG